MHEKLKRERSTPRTAGKEKESEVMAGRMKQKVRRNEKAKVLRTRTRLWVKKIGIGI